MADCIPLVDIGALPVGRGLRVCKAGHDLAVFRVGDSVFAIDDSCPHAGGSLANGQLNGTRVRCPVHGLMFELDPRRSPGPPMLAVRQHVVQVVDNMLVLDLRERDGGLVPGAA